MDGLQGFIERHADDAGEVLWAGALAWLHEAAERAGEGKWGRWRFYPRGELRRLRRDVAAALELARLAVAIQEAENDYNRELMRPAREAQLEAERKRRREQTMPAELARLAKQRARKGRTP